MNPRTLVVLLSLLFTTACFGQEEIEWQPGYVLTLKDFWSPATRFDGNMISVHPGCRIEFSYQMSNYEFMFRKNFNDKVDCKFLKTAATIIAPDSNLALDLLRLAQYGFDLTELYARKFRKRLFEEKGAFSGAQFFQPVFNEVEKEHAVQFNNAVEATQFGKDAAKLKELHASVLREIEVLSDFCKECKPKKSKKPKE